MMYKLAKTRCRSKLDQKECSNYRGIKLMCHGTKRYERLVEDRLRQVIEISSTQYGFQQGKSTTEPIFALRIVYITDERKHIISEPKRIIGRWLGHFKHLLNIENERDGNMPEVNQREDAQHTIIEPFELMEVEKQMKKAQNNKACGPDGVPTESLRLVDKIEPILICDQLNAALEKVIQTVWRTSILTPLYKGKGNVAECSNYRGIKLMCHGTKRYERLVEDRLRQVIEISSTQYGFQQGKSTTEPIFALRMVQEKHLEKKTKSTYDL